MMMRFKEGDRDGGQQDDQAVTPNTPSPDSNPPTTHQHHQGHVDAIARSRAALNKLLGREPHSAGADTAAAPANKPVSVQPRRVPAFEAPLNVPVYSRRREVWEGGDVRGGLMSLFSLMPCIGAMQGALYHNGWLCNPIVAIPLHSSNIVVCCPGVLDVA